MNDTELAELAKKRISQGQNPQWFINFLRDQSGSTVGLSDATEQPIGLNVPHYRLQTVAEFGTF